MALSESSHPTAKRAVAKIPNSQVTQEPIVDEETWLLAQKLRQNVRKAYPMEMCIRDRS